MGNAISLGCCRLAVPIAQPAAYCRTVGRVLRRREDAMKRLVMLFIVVSLPSVLWAQETTDRWPGLDPSALSTVYVIDDAGRETVGQLLRLEQDSLVMIVNQMERRFEAQQVRRIEKRGDSLKNGVVIGAIIGVVVGAVGAGMLGCPGENPSGSCPAARLAAPVLSAGVYAALDAGIDALFTGRTTVYEATVVPLSSGSGLSAPSFVDQRVALRVKFRW